MGLTANEAKAYEMMLRLGKTTASHISKESKVPYGRIYNVLASLEEKGLIKTVPEATKKFLASDPERLHEIIYEKIRQLNVVEKKIQDFKSLYSQQGREAVQVVKGRNSFRKITKEQITPKEYSYNIKYNFSVDPSYLRSGIDNQRRKIDSRTLGRITPETRKSVGKWLKINKNIKPIPNEGIAMSIQDDKEVMISLIKSNTIMLINDEPLAKLLKELFLAYYDKKDQDNGKGYERYETKKKR